MVKNTIHTRIKFLALFVMCTFCIEAQTTAKPLTKLKTGDTLKVNIERNSDIGLFDREQLQFVKVKDVMMMHSGKRGRWYKLSKDAFETFEAMEKKGLKQPRVSVPKFDAYILTLNGASESFQLLSESFNNFLAEVK